MAFDPKIPSFKSLRFQLASPRPQRPAPVESSVQPTGGRSSFEAPIRPKVAGLFQNTALAHLLRSQQPRDIQLPADRYTRAPNGGFSTLFVPTGAPSAKELSQVFKKLSALTGANISFVGGGGGRSWSFSVLPAKGQSYQEVLAQIRSSGLLQFVQPNLKPM